MFLRFLGKILGRWGRGGGGMKRRNLKEGGGEGEEGGEREEGEGEKQQTSRRHTNQQKPLQMNRNRYRTNQQLWNLLHHSPSPSPSPSSSPSSPPSPPMRRMEGERVGRVVGRGTGRGSEKGEEGVGGAETDEVVLLRGGERRGLRGERGRGV